MDKLDKNIKEYYMSQSLSEDRMEEILGESSGKTSLKKFYIPMSIAASLLIALLATSVFYFDGYMLTKRVVKEIEMNHNKKLAVEMVSSDYSQLSGMLAKLDFELVEPDSQFTKNYELVGGRYCSIQGELAAQLKLKHKVNGTISTLYAASLNPELQKIKLTDKNTSTTSIKLWNSDNIFYGLAEDL
ncbi:MAG: hypothetical protein GWO07_01195 [Candidatus Dadabacteria bacterium]|nr:hypothetical protein [Candidatus Dadabacteria bacterium]NIV41351.1 hypothetical protein [Candidatus Dadabacteria bacterium]NIX14562.1 hypothetical protein [Candidatus Dadabacteria bacterium]